MYWTGSEARIYIGQVHTCFLVSTGLSQSLTYDCIAENISRTNKLSCLVVIVVLPLSCLVLSRLVSSQLISSHLVLSCRCLVSSPLVSSCLALPCRVMSCFLLCCHSRVVVSSCDCLCLDLGLSWSQP